MRKGGKAEKWAARQSTAVGGLARKPQAPQSARRGRAAAEPDGRGKTPDGRTAEADDPDFRRNPGSEGARGASPSIANRARRCALRAGRVRIIDSWRSFWPD